MMSLLDKLFPSRRSCKNNVRTSVASNVGSQGDDRDSTLCLGTGEVRILLFRECESRGRKLLFDSLSLEKQWRSKSRSAAHDLKTNASPPADPVNFREKTAEDDVNLLSEMVFGTVAMTYKGSSFKIHSMNSPPCIMCTKVFSATEHNAYKPSEKVSDEGLGRSMNLDSNSSIRTVLSQPSTGNLSGPDLTAGPRKNSTCSSTGSGWDIDIRPPMGSSHSLESSGSSGIGSLSSLRRRWLRVVSTSLARSDSDDAFGVQWHENASDNRENHGKRHKTRLGLTMLVRLAEGHERRIEASLLEHMALLEGMLDRLRYFCIESSSSLYSQNKGPQLPERLYKSSFKFVVSLLRLLTNVNARHRAHSPLLWHDVLLNSVRIEHKMDTLNYSLHRMCQLLEQIDTKSTNFFLSTVVTAVLTYHLGWIYTALPIHDRQLMEKMGTLYPCNPLWAQLGDLYGALGNPIRVAHTVVAGDPQKVELINSVLSFLTYFIRSGIVQKRPEYFCTTEEDIQEAANLLEQARLKRPHLFHAKAPCSDRGVSRRAALASSCKQIPARERPCDAESSNAATQRSYARCTVDRLRAEGSVSPLKRSTTVGSNLDAFMLKPAEPEREAKSPSKEVPRSHRENENSVVGEETCASGKVKIIVSHSASQDIDVTKTDGQHCPELSLRNIEKKLEDDDTEEPFANFKSAALQGHNDASIDALKFYSGRPDFESGQTMADEMKNAQVFFMLGEEEKKSARTLPRAQVDHSCQCSYMFTRVPSTSAQLPEGVLRKIIQRNFPESSKSIQSSPGAPSGMTARFCTRCNGQGFVSSQNFDSSKQVLETPTNATEVLRTCGGSGGDGNVGFSRSNSLEALMEASSVVELPMPRSKKMKKTDSKQDTGFTNTLMQNRIESEVSRGTSNAVAEYTWGLVLQGLPKKKRRKKKTFRQKENDGEVETESEWWYYLREECIAGVRFPTVDQPIAESLCILADLDTWNVGIISNNTPSHSAPLPVGMSRLVSDMLEGFAYLWRKYHSTSHCVGILEAKLREMWLKSEALAEMLMATELCDANVANLSNALDLDAADIPLLLAVATSHSPEIAQRFGLTLA